MRGGPFSFLVQLTEIFWKSLENVVVKKTDSALLIQIWLVLDTIQSFCHVLPVDSVCVTQEEDRFCVSL